MGRHMLEPPITQGSPRQQNFSAIVAMRTTMRVSFLVGVDLLRAVHLIRVAVPEVLVERVRGRNHDRVGERQAIDLVEQLFEGDVLHDVRRAGNTMVTRQFCLKFQNIVDVQTQSIK